MSRRTLLLVVLALGFAAVCVSLGRWQLRRLAERRAHNAVVARRLGGAPQPVATLRDPAATLRYRRVTARGVFDYAHELALGARSHDGSPGADILTPLRLPGADSAVLVDRGWVYSPDGVTVDFARWRERDTAAVTGYVAAFAPERARPATSRSHPRTLLRASYDSLAARLPYPVRRFYVVQLGDSSAAAPVRLAPPPLDEGPHRSYAIQWFAFAAIAVVGAAAVVARERGVADASHRDTARPRRGGVAG